jgi:phytoene dehydrogenase-like protein
MAKYDIVVIGAGAAGLTAGALLAKNGKKVLVMDRDKHLGGRGMAIPFEGYRLSLGGHLLEDGGSGITKIISYLGGELKHGKTSKGMPVYIDGRWQNIQALYTADKDELKKVIRILTETPWSELDKWDDKPLREWILQYTKSEGVIALFEYIAVAECMTENWYDHSASDNLYVRKMHYSERRIAGYSCWPEGGWHGIFDKLAKAFTDSGGELWMETSAHRVMVENRKVKGVRCERQKPAMMTEAYNWETVEADAVVSTLPVWNVLNVVRERDLPDWYVAKIKTLAQDKFKACWLGYYVASREPIYTGVDLTELAIWFESPHSKLPGWAFLATGYDESVAPPGVHLFNCGFVYQGARDSDWNERMFDLVDQDLATFYPTLWNDRNILWKRRHIVEKPAFGVSQKPGLVGIFRPDYSVPGLDGMWFASETFRSRGIGVDRAARAGLTVAEKILGQRIPEFKDSPHD